MPPFEYLHRNIFGLLHKVRRRPGTWVMNLSELEAIIHGFYTGIAMHGIHEDVPRMTRSHFGIWLFHKTKWSTSAGWAYAIEHNTNSEQEAIDTFFDFVDQYRQLRPTVRAKVKLKPHHQKTGKRVPIGMNGKMDRPDEIHIVNYAPTRLHHFRYIYGDRIVDDWLDDMTTGSHSSRLKALYECAKVELGIEPNEWTVVRKTKNDAKSSERPSDLNSDHRVRDVPGLRSEEDHSKIRLIEDTKRNIFVWLDQVRLRPFLHIRNLFDLEAMTRGYHMGIEMHGIHEEVPRMTLSHFGRWLYETKKLSTCSGWAYIIRHNSKSEEESIDTFFEFVDQYRQLKPTVKAFVRLKPHHQPNPKRHFRNVTSPIDRPDEIRIVRYAPSRFYHFRYIYGNRIEEHMLSMTRLKSLYEWAKDEFGIEPEEWTVVRKSKNET